MNLKNCFTITLLILVAGGRMAYPQSILELVSIDSAGNQVHCPLPLQDCNNYPALNADGRFVAFHSNALGLVTGDTNGFRDIFIRDRQASQTTRVMGLNGTEPNNVSASPALSANGQFVAFASWANNLVVGDTGWWQDIFVYDRLSGQTTRVSVNSKGQQAINHSYGPRISADGRFVSFQSSAANLVAGDTSSTPDIFVHDRQTGQTTRVSVNSQGQQAMNRRTEGWSCCADISADGRYIAFQSNATNLVLNDTNGCDDIFVHDRQTGLTTRISISSNGQQGNRPSQSPSISADGRYVAFMSASTTLVAGDTNNVSDVFVHDRLTGETTRVSVSSTGQQADRASFYPRLSGDGRFVTFRSQAWNLVPGIWFGESIYVYDRATGRVTSAIPSGFLQTRISGDPVISADGWFVAFQSYSPILASDKNMQPDIYISSTFER